MKKGAGGFTIVELLIVIVVIGILAAITIIAFGNIQARARDNARYADAKAIVKALELYKASNDGQYPTTFGTTNPIATCPAVGNGYSYSWDTEGKWLQGLKDSGIMPKPPVPTPNDCTRYYQYYRGSANTWGCTTLTKGWYLLRVYGAEGVVTPQESATFRPCPEATVTATASSGTWVFSGYEN